MVGNGIKAQSGNPEVKVKGTDPVINQIIDKLKHVIQVSSGPLLLVFSVVNDKWLLSIARDKLVNPI